MQWWPALLAGLALFGGIAGLWAAIMWAVLRVLEDREEKRNPDRECLGTWEFGARKFLK